MYAPDQGNACVGKQLTTMSHPLAMLLLTIKKKCKMNFKTIKKADREKIRLKLRADAYLSS